MCDPASLALAGASAAASAGGSYLNASGQASNQAAAINAKNAGAVRGAQENAALTQQGQHVFQNVLGPYQNAAPNLSAAQGSNTALFNNNAPTADMISGGATTGNAPHVVQQDANTSVANRMAKTAASNSAFGNLTGYDSMNGANDRAIRGAGDQLNTLSDFGRNNASTNTALTNADMTNSQKAPSPFGDILSGVGQIGSFYAGKGSFGNLFGGGK